MVRQGMVIALNMSMVTQESRAAGVDAKKRPVQQERPRPLTSTADPAVAVRSNASGKPFDDDDPYADVPCTD